MEAERKALATDLRAEIEMDHENLRHTTTEVHEYMPDAKGNIFCLSRRFLEGSKLLYKS